MIDLHIHTAASDGQHTATEIVAMAAGIGLRAIAIADHNSVWSVSEGETAAAGAGIEFASCVELDTLFRGRDLHLLGYFIEHDSAACRAYLAEIFREKLAQTKKRVEKLRALGFALVYEELIEIAGDRLPYGVDYMAALLRRPENLDDPRVRAYVDGPRSNSPYLNFYLDWLKAGRPAFVPLDVQPTERAIGEVRRLGGVPVLAHPSDTPREDVHALVDLGLMGLEAWSSYHDRETALEFAALAKDRGILITAGSDFHGRDRKPDVLLGGVDGNEYSLFEKLRSAAGR